MGPLTYEQLYFALKDFQHLLRFNQVQVIKISTMGGEYSWTRGTPN